MGDATIWKFALQGGDHNDFWAEMPANAHVLSVGWQDGGFVAWAIVNPDAEREVHWLHIAGTGHPINPVIHVGGRYLGRVEINAPSGLLQFHPFDTLRWRAGQEGAALTPETVKALRHYG